MDIDKIFLVELSMFKLVKFAFIAKATTNLSLGVTEAGQFNPLLVGSFLTDIQTNTVVQAQDS